MKKELKLPKTVYGFAYSKYDILISERLLTPKTYKLRGWFNDHTYDCGSFSFDIAKNLKSFRKVQLTSDWVFVYSSELNGVTKEQIDELSQLFKNAQEVAKVAYKKSFELNLSSCELKIDVKDILR